MATFAPYYKLDKDNNVIHTSMEEYGRWMEEEGNKRVGGKDGDIRRRVAKDSLDGVWEVSTVFLGLDHAFGDGPPVLFESMIFWKENEYEKTTGDHIGEYKVDPLTYTTSDHPLHNWEKRYHTWDEALDGHKEIVQHLLANDFDWFEY